MQYFRTFTLKDGRSCTIRNGNEQDGQQLLDLYIATHTQTDYLLTYPEETNFTAEQEGKYLRLKAESSDEAELVAEVDGKLAASAGISCVNRRLKTKHRAEFGIAVDEAYKGLGIGRALTEACMYRMRREGRLFTA